MAEAFSQTSTPITAAKLTRWSGAQHPNQAVLTQRMVEEGARPQLVIHRPATRIGAVSHGYAKIICCVEGSVEIALPDLGQRAVLREGDRLEIPRGMRYTVSVDLKGAKCLEGAIRTSGSIRTPSLS